MPGKFLPRTDTTSTEACGLRIELVKCLEEDTVPEIQTAINEFLVGLPARFPHFNFDVISLTRFHYVNSVGMPTDHHVACLLMYFEGTAVGDVPENATL